MWCAPTTIRVLLFGANRRPACDTPLVSFRGGRAFAARGARAYPAPSTNSARRGGAAHRTPINPRPPAGRPALTMDQREKRINWRLRIGFVLCAIIGFAWGFLLTALLTRLNSYQSPWLILGAALPLAFFGSMVVGMAFDRMLLSWLKVVRVLVAMPIFAAGVPVGLVWGMVEQQRNLPQLVNATSRLAWDLELLFATVGVLAGCGPVGRSHSFDRWVASSSEFWTSQSLSCSGSGVCRFGSRVGSPKDSPQWGGRQPSCRQDSPAPSNSYFEVRNVPGNDGDGGSRLRDRAAGVETRQPLPNCCGAFASSGRDRLNSWHAGAGITTTDCE